MTKKEATINRLIEGTGLSRKEIEVLMDEKVNELKGLISEEGALFIISKEMGVDVPQEKKFDDFGEFKTMTISQIERNMKNITLNGK